MSEGPLVSVIVPVLDEAAILGALLDHLSWLPGYFEVLVADGGSRDGSLEIAGGHPLEARVVEAPRGRATQLGAGAAGATGEALLFLHADTRLPPTAHAQLASALADPDCVGGNFALRFDGDDLMSRMLGAWYAAQRRLSIYYGDSAIWVRASAFHELGGFLPLPIMEDYDFVRRLERHGRTRCLPGPAVTSARRWQRLGVPRTVFAWVAIRWLFLAGVDPARLARLYPHAR
jgi:rSAM/selenodomain-associated transferase 2